jgi:hypothetical protein
MSILYVCESCSDISPETCGKYDRSELRVLPNGDWICEDCILQNEETKGVLWESLLPPPEYGPMADAPTVAVGRQDG